MGREVRMIRPYAQWRVGQLVDMVAEAAAELVERGMAMYVDAEPESMAVEPERNAMKPAPRKRGRPRKEQTA